MSDPVPASGEPKRVLFACTLNRVRSPMAEALARHFAGQRLTIDSVGVRIEDDEPDLFCLAVLDEIGLDLGRYKPKTFEDLENPAFDLVISLSPEAHHKAMELTRTVPCEVEYWPSPDPTAVEGNREMRLAAYRELRDLLAKRIRERFAAAPPANL